jgi:hypothetical protein
VTLEGKQKLGQLGDQNGIHFCRLEVGLQLICNIKSGKTQVNILNDGTK